jgi:hypothetical protein
MELKADTVISFEQYAEWARSRYPGYHPGDELSPTEEVVYSAPTEPPVSSDACPVTVKSNQNRVIVTPAVKRSR